MRIYPAIHYTMGGLWVDYNLMSTVPGLHVLGEANFSDHGANRLGASALMQGLADGYFVIPYTIGDYLAEQRAAEGHHRSRRLQGSGQQRAGADQQAALGERQPRHPRHPPRTRAHHVGRRRDGADRCEPAARAGGDSQAARRVLAQRVGAGHARQPEPEPRVRRPRRRLPRVRRTAGARRARSQASRAAGTSAKKARRRTAKRCATTSTTRTWRRGSSRASARSRSCTRSRSSFDEVHPSQRSYK